MPGNDCQHILQQIRLFTLQNGKVNLNSFQAQGHRLAICQEGAGLIPHPFSQLNNHTVGLSNRYKRAWHKVFTILLSDAHQDLSRRIFSSLNIINGLKENLHPVLNQSRSNLGFHSINKMKLLYVLFRDKKYIIADRHTLLVATIAKEL